MKKVLNIGLGGRSFIIDEDAYNRLQAYLEHFRSKLAGILRRKSWKTWSPGSPNCS